MYISRNTAAVAEGKSPAHPYQIGLLDMCTSQEISELVVQKSHRMGYSKAIGNTLAQYAVEFRKTGKVWNSRATDSEKYVRREINPMLKDMPILREIMPKSGLKRTEDTLQTKKFYGCDWLFDGAHSPDNFKADTLSLGIGDEVSTWPALVGASGSAPDLIRGRLTVDPSSKLILGSTPLELPNCLITKERKAMQIQLQFHCPCPHCKELQVLSFDAEEEFGLQFNMTGSFNDTADTAHYVCFYCGEKFRYADALLVQKGGMWMDSERDVYLNHEDGKIWDQDGKLNKWRLKVGLKMNILISPYYNWTRFIYSFLKAQEEFEQGNPGKAITFRNEKEGEPWEADEGIKRISAGVIGDRAEQFPPGGAIPNEIKVIVAWADVQKDRIEVGTCGFSATQQWFLEYRVIAGDVLDSSEPWEQLERFFMKEYVRVDGSRQGIFLRGLDRGYAMSIDRVDLLCRSFPDFGMCIPTQGHDWPGREIAKFPHKPTKRIGEKGGVYLTHVSTHTAKTLIYTKLAIMPVENDGVITYPDGYIHFPAPDEHHAQFTPEFYRQLVAGVPKARTVEGKHGYRFENNGRRDEVQDVMVGCLVLFDIAKNHKGVDLSSDEIAGAVVQKYDLKAIGAKLRK